MLLSAAIYRQKYERFWLYYLDKDLKHKNLFKYI